MTYMTTFKQILDNKTNEIIEMPTGTGKTASMFALVTSFKAAYPDKIFKIVFCTRTVSQLEKAAEELRLIMTFLNSHLQTNITSQIISARRNLCVNNEVTLNNERTRIDACCKKMIKYQMPSSCRFYEEYEKSSTFIKHSNQVMNIEDLLLYGKETGICPYYGSRAMIPISDIILCNYPYVIDYRVNEELMRHLDKNSVVLID